MVCKRKSSTKFHSVRFEFGPKKKKKRVGINIRGSNTKLLSIYFYFKLYVLWLDPPPIENPGIETLYVEVARRSGGEFYFTTAGDFSQAGRGQPAEMEHVTEVRNLIVNTTASGEE